MEEGLLFREVLTPPATKRGRPCKEETVRLQFRLSAAVKRKFELFFEQTGGGEKELAEKFEILLDLASTHSDMRDGESSARAVEVPATNYRRRQRSTSAKVESGHSVLKRTGD